MSHLIDSQTVRNIELAMMEKKLKEDWDLHDSFQLVDKRNKEIGMVMLELEELAWRGSAMFTDKEYDSIKQLVSVDRNWRAFDKEFYDNDMKSMD